MLIANNIINPSNVWVFSVIQSKYCLAVLFSLMFFLQEQIALLFQTTDLKTVFSAKLIIVNPSFRLQDKCSGPTLAPVTDNDWSFYSLTRTTLLFLNVIPELHKGTFTYFYQLRYKCRQNFPAIVKNLKIVFDNGCHWIRWIKFQL